MSLKETSFKIKVSQFKHNAGFVMRVLNFRIRYSILSCLILSYLVNYFAFAGVVSVLENGSRAPGTTSID